MPETSSGLMASAKRLLSTLTSIVSTRLELLSDEVQEERLRLTQMLFFALCALFLFGIGILLLTVFILVLFWDDHRLVVLGGLSVLFFALGTIMAILLRNQSRVKPKLFSDSLAELVKDREYLEAGQDQPDSL
jgi:uncharacterized membrane protein YqjE